MLRQLRARYRGWGKYAAELVIVAVGVALGLWATTWASDRTARTEVSDAYQALNRELFGNLNAVRFREQVAPCVRDRVSELRGWIGRHSAGERTPLPAEVGRPGAATLGASVWDVTKAGQVASKMPLEARLRYAAVYDSLENFSELQISERDVWFAIGDFAGLADVPAPELARLQGLVSRAAAFDEALSSNYPNIIRQFAQLGVTGDRPLRRGLVARRAICQPFLDRRGA